MKLVWRLLFGRWRLLFGRWGHLWAAACCFLFRALYGRPLTYLEVLLWATVTFILGTAGGALISRLRSRSATRW
jgi:hypothetical protein